MARITERDRIEEFENIQEMLNTLEVAAKILEAGPNLEESCMLISLPTNVEDWEEEYKEDLHIATGYLIQMGEEENQQTKYLMLYMPVQVDLTSVDELVLLKLANELNQTLPVGACFVGKDKNSERVLLQIKCFIGGYVEEFLDEGVVCEAVFELGSIYDRLKEQLLDLVQQSEQQ